MQRIIYFSLAMRSNHMFPVFQFFDMDGLLKEVAMALLDAQASHDVLSKSWIYRWETSKVIDVGGICWHLLALVLAAISCYLHGLKAARGQAKLPMAPTLKKSRCGSGHTELLGLRDRERGLKLPKPRSSAATSDA